MRRKKLSLANLSRGAAAENPGLVYVISRGKIKVQRSRLMGWSWPLTLEKRETSFLSFHRLLSVAWPTRHAHLVHMCDVAHPKTKVGNHWPQARKSVIPFPKSSPFLDRIGDPFFNGMRLTLLFYVFVSGKTSALNVNVGKKWGKHFSRWWSV